MKKIISLLFFLFLILGEVQTSTAHPLDVSNTTLSLYETTVGGVTYIHPVELDRILVNDGKVTPMQIGVDTYYTLTGVLVKYLSETIMLSNNGEKCILSDFTFQEELMIDEIYSQGFPISYIFHCNSKIINPIVTINFMIDVPLQTNRLYIYRSIEGGAMTRTDYRVLNAQKNSHSVEYIINGNSLNDTDNDGIVDEDELLYRTDPKNPDSDNDGYSDGVEIHTSWNPLSASLSPGQRAYSDSQIVGTPVPETGSSTTQPVNLSDNTGVWGSKLFTKILSEIRMYVDQEIGSKELWVLLIFIGTLGFLHALGPGHSKGILISQILDEQMSYKKTFLYSFVFTVVHLLDIIVVVLLSKVFFNYLDSSIYLSFITKISAYLVFFVGGYLFFSSLQRYLKRKGDEDNEVVPKKNKKNYLFLAVITGLTPCAFGWSIFLMLLALGKASLALPMLFALGTGIFLCLLLIGTVTWYSKTKIYKYSPRISLFSPVVSASFILFIGAGLVLQGL